MEVVVGSDEDDDINEIGRKEKKNRERIAGEITQYDTHMNQQQERIFQTASRRSFPKGTTTPISSASSAQLWPAIQCKLATVSRSFYPSILLAF